MPNVVTTGAMVAVNKAIELSPADTSFTQQLLMIT